MIKVLQFKKKQWSKREIAIYQPSTEEERKWEEGMLNFKRKRDYCVKSNSDSLGCLAREVYWLSQIEPAIEARDWDILF